MSYFMRYLATERLPTMAEVNTVLAATDAAYLLVADAEDETIADLYYGDGLLGELSINPRSDDDDLAEEDLDDLLDELAKQDNPASITARAAIEGCIGMVAVHVLRAGHEEAHLLEPLWRYLFEQGDGLLQIDDDGIYDADNKLVVGLMF